MQCLIILALPMWASLDRAHSSSESTACKIGSRQQFVVGEIESQAKKKQDACMEAEDAIRQDPLGSFLEEIVLVLSSIQGECVASFVRKQIICHRPTVCFFINVCNRCLRLRCICAQFGNETHHQSENASSPQSCNPSARVVRPNPTQRQTRAHGFRPSRRMG